MKIIKQIFDDNLTKAAGLVFLLFIALVIFNSYSNVPTTNPLIGVILFGLAPVLFVIGGIIFVIAILRF
jgi:hypothetical protein